MKVKYEILALEIPGNNGNVHKKVLPIPILAIRHCLALWVVFKRNINYIIK